MDQAVALGDWALRHGLSPDVLNAALVEMERWPGVRQARRAVEFLDRRSESVGESVSRLRLDIDGLPAPALQQDILDSSGELIARVDWDLIRDCDLQVARWIWRDLHRPSVIRDRVLRAFARTAARS